MQYVTWIFLAILYYPLLRQLYRFRWVSIDYTHAYFILPISVWLVWRMRARLRAAAALPVSVFQKRAAGFYGCLLLFCGLILLLFGWRREYLIISAGSIIPALFGLSIYLYGFSPAKIAAFPILYLLLMVPPPLGVLDSITVPMRYWNTAAAGFILKFLHFPVTRDALTLSLNGNEIYVGPACSGFRSLITMISICAAYIYAINAGPATKAILASSIIPLALFGNLLRIIGACVATFYFGITWGEKIHDIGGYAIFLGLIMAMMELRSYLDKRTLCQKGS